jgi:hypothetical protein
MLSQNQFPEPNRHIYIYWHFFIQLSCAHCTEHHWRCSYPLTEGSKFHQLSQSLSSRHNFTYIPYIFYNPACLNFEHGREILLSFLSTEIFQFEKHWSVIHFPIWLLWAPGWATDNLAVFFGQNIYLIISKKLGLESGLQKPEKAPNLSNLFLKFLTHMKKKKSK